MQRQIDSLSFRFFKTITYFNPEFYKSNVKLNNHSKFLPFYDIPYFEELNVFICFEYNVYYAVSIKTALVIKFYCS